MKGTGWRLTLAVRRKMESITRLDCVLLVTMWDGMKHQSHFYFKNLSSYDDNLSSYDDYCGFSMLKWCAAV